MYRAVMVIALGSFFGPLVGVSTFLAAAQPPGDEDTLPGKEPGLPLEEPRQQTIRDKLVKWVKENGDPRIPDTVAAQIDKTLAGTNNFRYAIGANLNNTGKSYLFECWDNRLYSFALSAAQAKALQLTPLSILQFGPTAKQKARRLATPLVRLEGVRYKAGDSIANTAKIDGEVTLQANKAASGRYVLRLSYRRGNAVAESFHYLDALPMVGAQLAFSFPPINPEQDKDRFTGPMPLYLDLCKMVQKNNDTEITIYSNALAAMVNVVSGGGN